MKERVSEGDRERKWRKSVCEGEREGERERESERERERADERPPFVALPHESPVSYACFFLWALVALQVA
jgi:hypothetical protein